MADEFTIAVEIQLMNPPKPGGFGVMQNGQPIAWLTLEQVETAIERYRQLEAARTEGD